MKEMVMGLPKDKQLKVQVTLKKMSTRSELVKQEVAMALGKVMALLPATSQHRAQTRAMQQWLQLHKAATYNCKCPTNKEIQHELYFGSQSSRTPSPGASTCPHH